MATVATISVNFAQFNGTDFASTPTSIKSVNPLTLTQYCLGTTGTTNLNYNGGFVKKGGDTMTGALILSESPTQSSPPLQAATREFVTGNYVAKGGDTMTGFLTLNAAPTQALHAATKEYVDVYGGAVIISDTEPTGVTTGKLWYNSTNGVCSIYYNDGNTTQWVDIASSGLGAGSGGAGSVGPTGPTGPQGIPGPTGPAGSGSGSGATGPTGPTGPAGANGLNGTNGSQGPAGPTGPTGAAAPTQGVAKAWVNFNGTTSPGTIRSSYNVSSVTRNSTGLYTINFTTPMSNANYASASHVGSSFGSAAAGLRTTSSMQINTQNGSFDPANFAEICLTIFGN
jgi:hypothetical protein